MERQHMEEDDSDGVARCFRNDAQSASVRRREPTPSPSSSPGHQHCRRHYSYLQHFVDDVLLRIFEFIDCSSLVRTGAVCHRFRELSTRSAEQRTHRLADGRILSSAMRMLRAQEQIDGVGPREGSGPFVRIPMLGLPRRVRVSGAGDPEYDGVYFCTGCNGNGFLFTKPRWPERRVRPVMTTQDGDGGGGAWMMNNGDDVDARPPWGLNDEGWMEEIPDRARGMGDAAAAAAEGNAVFRHDANDGDGIDENDEDAAPGGNGRRRQDSVDVLFGDESNRSRLLRCVIAKRFSNETILWYMSKEMQDDATREITQIFSFWAKLLVTGDAAPDVCQYPSQTSILSRNGNPAWQNLTSTVGVSAPIVELLDN